MKSLSNLDFLVPLHDEALITMYRCRLFRKLLKKKNW